MKIGKINANHDEGLKFVWKPDEISQCHRKRQIFAEEHKPYRPDTD